MTNSKVKQADIQTTTYKTAGTASAYTLTIPKLTSLVDELTFVVEFHVENDASATLNINSLGAIAIMTSEGNAVDAGDLKTTGRYTLVYDAGTASFIVSETVDSEVEEVVTTTISVNGTSPIIPVVPGIWALTRVESVQRDWTYYYIVDWVSIKKFDVWYNQVDIFTHTSVLWDIVVDGGYVYVANDTDDVILKIDTTTMTVSDTYSWTYIQTHMTKCGNYLVCSCGNNDGRLLKIDLTTFTYVDTSWTGKANINFNITADDNYVYARNQANESINKIDVLTRTVVDSAAHGLATYNVQYYDGYVYYNYVDYLYRADVATMTPANMYTNINSTFWITWWHIYILTDASSISDWAIMKLKPDGSIVWYLPNVYAGVGWLVVWAVNNKLFISGAWDWTWLLVINL